jgi:hypothetical protein
MCVTMQEAYTDIKMWCETLHSANKNWHHPKYVLTTKTLEALCEQYFGSPL